MVTEKPIVARWRKSAVTTPIFSITLASVFSLSITVVMVFNLVRFKESGLEEFIADAIITVALLGVTWFIAIYFLLKDNPYKPSLKIIDSTPGLEHKLNLAYKKAYETQTVEYGVATEDGLICKNGFAPWDAITRITFKSREDRGKNSSPCCMDVEVKLNEKTSYSLSETFSQIRDVSEEIEQQIERIHKFDKSILIINNYIFIG